MLRAQSAIQNTFNTNKRALMVTAAAIALGAIIMYLFYVKILKPRISSTYTANKEFVNKGDDDNTVDLLYFYTTWCPYCKKARPEWDKFRSQWEEKGIDGYKLQFTEVDCDINESLADKYKVDGYPTIKMVKNGKVMNYDAKPEQDTLNRFLKSYFS
jgi:thiol-disulfide isomerase/thioredoxin